MSVAQAARVIREHKESRLEQRKRPDLSRYKDDPFGFAWDVLGVHLWGKAKDIAESLLKPPYRASVDSGHNVGKSHLCAVLIVWWYFTRNPGVVITTAPTKAGVEQIVWTEVRLLIMNAKIPLPWDFIGDSAPEMRSSPDHYARGYTARDGVAFVGRHRRNSLFIFDEKEGVKAPFWLGTSSMVRPGSGDAWLVVGNPFTTSTIAYQEHNATDSEGNPTWHRFQLSSLDHPNIKKFRDEGEKHIPSDQLPVPAAVTPGQVDQWLDDWCDLVVQGDEQETDIVWRGKRFRAGPIGEPRILGLRPTSSTMGVWSEAIWKLCVDEERGRKLYDSLPLDLLPVIGIDSANYGLDFTGIHVRCGAVSLYHQAVNGWTAEKITPRLVELCNQWAEWANQRRNNPALPPILSQHIEIRIDDDSEGRDISAFLEAQRYTVVRLNAASAPQRLDLYPNVRSELWFMAMKKASKGLVNFYRLDRATKERIKSQMLAPLWWGDTAGRKQVESKDELRHPDRLGRSPDDADACNLAFWERPSGGGIGLIHPKPETHQPSQTMEARGRSRGSGTVSGFGRGRR